MADGSEGGVTLRIDANTAAYIAKISNLAEGHEKVTKHVDNWGAAFDHALDKLKEMAGPLALIEGIVSSVDRGIEGWKKRMDDATKSAETMVDRLRQTTVQTGENRQSVEDALNAAKSPQGMNDRVAGFAAFRQNAPGSAGRVSAAQIGEKLGLAATAGYDATQLAGIAGNVEGAAPGAGAFDLAGLLVSRTGSNAGQASEMIRRISEKAGSGGAQAALPYLLASAQSGDRRFSFINEAANAYNPAFGDFGKYLESKLATAKPDQRGLANAITGNLGRAREDIAGLNGFVGRGADAALADPRVRDRVGTAERTNAAAIKSYVANDEEAAQAERRRANLAKIEAVGGAQGVVADIVHPLSVFANRAFGGKNGIDTDRPTRHFADFFTGEGDRTDRLVELLEEQNAIHRQKHLRPDAHAER